jgi:hypothetical protein
LPSDAVALRKARSGTSTHMREFLDNSGDASFVYLYDSGSEGITER